VLGALPWLVLLGFAFPLAWVDATQHRLPNRLVGLLTLTFHGVLVIVGGVEQRMPAVLEAIAGGAVLGAVFLIAALVNPTALGMGDVKLSFTIGTALVWLGWPWLWWGCILAFGGAAMWGIVRRIATGQRGPIALGPFLLGAPLGCALATALI
jgi:leader peptidase (prepilin peptidase)/N-methyltransferase